ncbi:unnamed protein product [Eruca vesicaria subsp. sativa]|uniref:Uncharacterized protein n=1 Tax=Eruca vesicaria subsp. sativa TaxID=29727 RepID=A0ABC8JN01_ERUVS|nr:unnamed protein product [Eruca vesicaria subsp. sativa]
MNLMFYFLLSLTTVLAVTASPGHPVLDIKGNIIFSGSYYVLPRMVGAGGGGLTLAPRVGHQCPLYVGMETHGNKGIPVRFSNWESRVGFVPEAENLNIEMDIKATTCVQSTYWYISASDSHFRTSLIAAGPKPNYFQIRKASEDLNSYKIVCCSEDDDEDCMDVGVFMDASGNWRLGLNSKPFHVVFIRASEDETLSKIKSII